MADNDINQEAIETAAEAEQPQEKKRKEKKPGRAKRGCIIAASIVGGIVGLFALFVAVAAIINAVGTKALKEQALSYEPVSYTSAQLVPTKDDDGYYTFETDRDFKVIQLTDVHIGAGFMSQQKDAWAMNAVATMVRESQPDLVVITGDIAYPVPFQAGTFNNLNAAKIFACEMESLGVYWTFCFGNHDTEAYSRYTRKQICDWYADQNFKYCLFEANNDIEDKDAAESFGYGNNIIKVKNSAGVVTQALVTFDSHSYTDGDVMGLMWKYDNIHQDQIDWYSAEMSKIEAANATLGAPGVVKNLSFFHIPLREYREAWIELTDYNEAEYAAWKESVGYDSLSIAEQKKLMREYDTSVLRDSANVDHVYGYNGERVGASMNPFASDGEDPHGVFCGVYKEELVGKFWAAAAAHGMQGAFCGHDHINNFSVNYTKDGYTMRLTYGLSVDYLAYSGIFKQHVQRGATLITVRTDGSFDCAQRNYYTDFGVSPEEGDLTDIG